LLLLTLGARLSWEPSAAGEITVTENNRLSITSDCIKCVRIGNKDLQAIQNALKSNTITAVHIKQSRLDDDGVKELASVLKEYKKLLKFSYTQSSSVVELMKALIGSNLLNSLTQLNLQQNNIGEEGAHRIVGALEKNTSLKELNLQQNKIGRFGAYYIAKALEENTSLTQLNLQQNNIGDDDALHIAFTLEKNTSLTKLNLQQNKIGDYGAYHIARALKKNTSLTELNLQQNNIGDDGALRIAFALEENTSLTELNLQQNNIGDYGSLGTQKMITSTPLRKLNLSANNINDRCVDDLISKLRSNTTLQQLDLTKNPAISQHSRDKLAEFKSRVIIEPKQDTFKVLKYQNAI
jgi:Ran GTPase-activating protein (RanGAP) involved in mRNA processing and transport